MLVELKARLYSFAYSLPVSSSHCCFTAPTSREAAQKSRDLKRGMLAKLQASKAEQERVLEEKQAHRDYLHGEPIRLVREGNNATPATARFQTSGAGCQAGAV